MTMLRTVRRMKDLSQDELGQLAGVPQPVLSKIERGVICPTPGIRQAQGRIAMALGYSIELLFPDFKNSAEKKPKS